MVWLWTPVPLPVLLLESLEAGYSVLGTQLRADPQCMLNVSSLSGPPTCLLALLTGLPGT